MRVTAAKAGPQLDRADPRIRLFLFSGADSSSSRLLAERLRTALGAQKVVTSAQQLKAEPRWLADEAATLSMFGEKRLLWIEPASEDVLPAIEGFLALGAIEAPAAAILPAATKKDSGLAKLAERHDTVLHIVSEQLSPREQVAAVIELAGAEGLKLAPHLAERIANEANGDLLLARLELAKFALYLGASREVPQTLEDEVVDALGADQSEIDFNGPGDLALTGNLAALGDALLLLGSGGTDPIPVVRALQRRLLTLAALRARLDNGQPRDSVMKSVWWREQPAVARMLERWTAPRLADALAHVQRLERELLLQPVPGAAALGESLLQLARVARR